MTVDEALAEVAAEIDARLAISRQRFEQSLIDNHAPEDALEDLLDWHEDYQREWRARALAAVAAEMRAALRDYPSGWAPIEPRDRGAPTADGGRL